MSNLLEQAIIDAAALKDVAMKNAEAALIEKYSKEFKQSVERLLEQEEPVAPETDPAAMPPATPDMSASAAPDPEKEKAFSKVKSSFLEGDEEEVITIDFDQLKKQLSGQSAGSSLLSTPPISAPPTPEAGAGLTEGFDKEEMDEMSYEKAKDAGIENPEKADLDDDEDVNDYEKNRAKAVQKAMSGEEKDESLEIDERYLDSEMDALSEEEMTLDEEELDEEVAEDALIDPKHAKKMHKKKNPVSTEDENFEVSPEELKELAEMLKVDISVENLSDGHMGTRAREKTQQRQMEFAAARDDKEVERMEEEEESMSDLKKKLDEALEVGSALVTENEDLNNKLVEMTDYLENLKENVEKLSISNAKLLYTNKVLGNVSLNERQKEQIVESISKSTSVLEAKTIYNTLQSTVSGVNSNKPKESLSEALNRGGSSPFLTRKQPLVEQTLTDRMKILAGITKKN